VPKNQPANSLLLRATSNHFDHPPYFAYFILAYSFFGFMSPSANLTMPDVTAQPSTMGSYDLSNLHFGLSKVILEQSRINTIDHLQLAFQRQQSKEEI
jgi:hypothetical protein